jgi:hypothetical protein
MSAGTEQVAMPDDEANVAGRGTRGLAERAQVRCQVVAGDEWAGDLV